MADNIVLHGYLCNNDGHLRARVLLAVVSFVYELFKYICQLYMQTIIHIHSYSTLVSKWLGISSLKTGKSNTCDSNYQIMFK